jgi:hypothetical protein
MNIPAFPKPKLMQQAVSFDAEDGMTLRDYFAAKAMQAIIDQQDVYRGEVDSAAWMAYRMADAMLKAREQ